MSDIVHAIGALVRGLTRHALLRCCVCSLVECMKTGWLLKTGNEETWQPPKCALPPALACLSEGPHSANLDCERRVLSSDGIANKLETKPGACRKKEHSPIFLLFYCLAFFVFLWD